MIAQTEAGPQLKEKATAAASAMSAVKANLRMRSLLARRLVVTDSFIGFWTSFVWWNDAVRILTKNVRLNECKRLTLVEAGGEASLIDRPPDSRHAVAQRSERLIEVRIWFIAHAIPAIFITRR